MIPNLHHFVYLLRITHHTITDEKVVSCQTENDQIDGSNWKSDFINYVRER